jgi:hypothetical protein
LDPSHYGGSVDQAVTELELLGLDVRLDRPTGSPSIADTFHFVQVDPDAAGVEIDDGSGGREPVATIDPESFNGVVTLIVPRPVAPGELPEWAGSAFGPGEPLAGLSCESWPLTSAQVADAAAARGVDVRWEVINSVVPDAGAAPVRSFSIDPTRGRVDGRVVEARLSTTPHWVYPGTVIVTVLPDDVPSTTSLRDVPLPPDAAATCDG